MEILRLCAGGLFVQLGHSPTGCWAARWRSSDQGIPVAENVPRQRPLIRPPSTDCSRTTPRPPQVNGPAGGVGASLNPGTGRDRSPRSIYPLGVRNNPVTVAVCETSGPLGVEGASSRVVRARWGTESAWCPARLGRHDRAVVPTTAVAIRSIGPRPWSWLRGHWPAPFREGGDPAAGQRSRRYCC